MIEAVNPINATGRANAWERWPWPARLSPASSSSAGRRLKRGEADRDARKPRACFIKGDRAIRSASTNTGLTPREINLAGRDTAKRFGVSYDWNPLVSDPACNTQMGAAEIGDFLAKNTHLPPPNRNEKKLNCCCRR
jgi:hypothetical protein